MKENESDFIHAIVFRSLDQGAKARTLITLHPNRASALDYFDKEWPVLGNTYHLPLADHAGEKVLGVAFISHDALRGTVYDSNPGRLYAEVALAVQAGEKCHKTVIDRRAPCLNAQSAEIVTAVAQATYRYVALKPVHQPQAPTPMQKTCTVPTRSP